MEIYKNGVKQLCVMAAFIESSSSSEEDIEEYLLEETEKVTTEILELPPQKETSVVGDNNKTNKLIEELKDISSQKVRIVRINKTEESPGERVLRIMKYMGNEDYLRVMAELSKTIHQDQCLAILRIIHDTMSLGINFEVNMHYVEEKCILEVKETEELTYRKGGICVNCINDKRDIMGDMIIGVDYMKKCCVTEVQLLTLEFILNELLKNRICCINVNSGNVQQLLFREGNRLDGYPCL